MKECNCESPFKMDPCPVHEETDHFTDADPGSAPKTVTITIKERMDIVDGVLLNKETTHVGIGFVCSHCKERSLLHFYKYCPQCGSSLEFK